MSDSWLKLVGNMLVAADEYVQYLNEQQPKKQDTEPVHTEEPKKTGKASDLNVGFCRNCKKAIHLAPFSPLHTGPVWIHSQSNGAHCTLFATPQG